MPGLEPLNVIVRPPQPGAVIVELAVQEPDLALQTLRRPQLLLQPGVLLPQRRDLLFRIAQSSRSPARPGLRRRNGRTQPSDLLAQGHDRAALARFDAGFRKELLQARHFGLQGKGVLRRAADFPNLLLGRTQLVPAGVELRLQRTHPRPRLQLRTAQFFATRFRCLRAHPLPFVQRLPVATRARRRSPRGRPNLSVALGQRQVCARILVANRHAHDASA